MHLIFSRTIVVPVLTALMITLGSTSLADDDQSFSRSESFEIDLKERTLVLRNLVGTVNILPANSDVARIEATVVSGDRESRRYLNAIEFDQRDDSRVYEVRTLYPVREYDHYIYRAEDYHSSNTQVRYQGRRVKVSSRSGLFDDALELHVDYSVYLPADSKFKLTHAAGAVNANDVNSDMNLDTSSGPIAVTNGSGDISIDTGSGRIEVSTHRGDVIADTGSGEVLLKHIDGKVMADTGSGSVRLDNINGDVKADTGSGSVNVEKLDGSLRADTGSGNINAKQVQGDVRADTGSGSIELSESTGSLDADTGSGSVIATDWIAGSAVRVDTGSGRVSLNGDLSAILDLNIDTGSGSVKLLTTNAPSIQLDVTANSSIDIDFPQLTDVRNARGSFEGVIGNGNGRGIIETESGSVTFELK